MEVHHRLAGGRAHIHADVVAVGLKLFVEEVFCLPDEGEEGGLFGVASKRPATWRKGSSETSPAPMRHPIPGLPFLLLFENTSVEGIVDPEIPLFPQPIHLLCK